MKAQRGKAAVQEHQRLSGAKVANDCEVIMPGKAIRVNIQEAAREHDVNG